MPGLCRAGCFVMNQAGIEKRVNGVAGRPKLLTLLYS